MLSHNKNINIKMVYFTINHFFINIKKTFFKNRIKDLTYFKN